MSNIIVVLGETGTGKSTSLNSNPKETFILTCLISLCLFVDTENNTIKKIRTY